MDYEGLYGDVRRILDELIEKNRAAPIIVEGVRDVRALRSLEISGEILAINRGQSVFGLCEKVAQRHRAAIILTDWDARGGRLARQLREGLLANGVRYDDQLRARLTTACRKDISEVEALGRYVHRLEAMLETRERSKPSKRWYAGRVQRWAVRRSKRRGG